MIMSLREFDLKPQNCRGSWKLSIMWQDPEHAVPCHASPAWWVVIANKCHVVRMQCWRRSSIRLLQMLFHCCCSNEHANQCNILYGDGLRVALKTRAVAFRYELFCAVWIAHARSYWKGIAWKHIGRKETRMSSFILALNSNQLFKYLWFATETLGHPNGFIHVSWKCWYFPGWLTIPCVHKSKPMLWIKNNNKIIKWIEGNTGHVPFPFLRMHTEK